MRDQCVRCLYPLVYIFTTAHRVRAFWNLFKPTHQKLTLHTQTLRAHPECRKIRWYGRSRQISDDWQPRPSNLVSYQWRLLWCGQICAAIDGGIRHDNAGLFVSLGNSFHRSCICCLLPCAYARFLSRAFCFFCSFYRLCYSALPVACTLSCDAFPFAPSHSLSFIFHASSFDHSRSHFRSHSRSHSCALVFARSLWVLLQYPVSEEIIKKQLDRNANRNGNQNRKGSYYVSFLTLFRIPLRAAFWVSSSVATSFTINTAWRLPKIHCLHNR